MRVETGHFGGSSSRFSRLASVRCVEISGPRVRRRMSESNDPGTLSLLLSLFFLYASLLVRA